jgi:hypothetical protein
MRSDCPISIANHWISSKSLTPRHKGAKKKENLNVFVSFCDKEEIHPFASVTIEQIPAGDVLSIFMNADE